MPLFLYRFDYKGVYLGGTALVLAKNLEDARQALRRFPPEGWKDAHWQHVVDEATVEQLMIPTFTSVLYNYDGDY